LPQAGAAVADVVPPDVPVDRAVDGMWSVGLDGDDVPVPWLADRRDDDYVVVEDGGLHAVPDDPGHVGVAARELPLHAQGDLDGSLRACWRWRDVRAADAHLPVRELLEGADVLAIAHGCSFRGSSSSGMAGGSAGPACSRGAPSPAKLASACGS